MAIRASTVNVEADVRQSQLSSEVAAEQPVVIERHGDAAAKVNGRWQKRYVLPALICALIGLGLSVAVLRKIGRSPSLHPGSVNSGKTRSSDPGTFRFIDDSLNDTLQLRFAEDYQANLNLLRASGSARKVDVLHSLEYPPPESRVQTLIEADVAADASAVFEDWGLPEAEEVENALSPEEKRGKLFLSEIVKQYDKTSSNPSSQAQNVLGVIARHVSGGVTDQLVGLSIGLVNVTEPAGGRTGNRTSRSFKVTKYLGEGAFKVVLEVFDLSAAKHSALSLFFSEYDNQGKNMEADWLQMNEMMIHEERIQMKACGPTPAALASDKRGIAVPLFTAEIASMPEVVRSDGMYVLRKVQVMERLGGDMHHLPLMKKSIPKGAKTYIAKRLLLQVLHLQEARVSHNDIKWSNLFMRADGSFLLGDFGSSCLLGERMNPLSGVTPSYTEPSLLSDFSLYLSQGLPARPDDKSDMWSLGVLLFELFTDGELPFNYQGNPNLLFGMKARANALIAMDVSPLRLVPEMQKAQTPRRWQELIVNLLEPRRSKRISGRETAREFSDFFGAADG